MQNLSHAVMAQRSEQKDSLDDFPTPPWATRALIQYVININSDKKLSCREPACGRGYMSKTLEEYFHSVVSSDIYNYGYGKTLDYLSEKAVKTDWLITNPPFNLAEQFIQKALNETNHGVAVLLRTVFLESMGRYKRLFSKNPPTTVAQFVERVPIVRGRIDKNAASATAYAWFVWNKNELGSTKVFWIPPCRKQLELKDDYQPLC